MSERAREAERRRDMLEAQAVLSEHRAREVEQELDKCREPEESHAALLDHVLAGMCSVCDRVSVCVSMCRGMRKRSSYVNVLRMRACFICSIF